ncbi:MAG: glycosyltransferase family 2 protein [Kiritimatiellae bacterium]|nr:glycosyltransferase family 2 protein [Kiritimatiellia bacterium]
MSGSQDNQVLVIIPCFNERNRIGNVIAEVKFNLPASDIVVINDSSHDGSGAEARTAGASVLTHSSNLGYGASLETGYQYAVRHKYNTVLQMDADGQHLASELPKLLQIIRNNESDIAIGSRYCKNEDTSLASPLRHFAHKIISQIIFIITRLRLSDPTSGFQALNKRALTFFSSGVFPCDYPDSDVIIMAHLAGLRVKEVQTNMQPRASGKSMHSGLTPVYYTLKMILAMFVVLLNLHAWRRWRNLNKET